MFAELLPVEQPAPEPAPPVKLVAFDPPDLPPGPCEGCVDRLGHLYMLGCQRCFARDMGRGVPRLERAKREELAKQKDAAWMDELRRLVAEERRLDAEQGYGRPRSAA
jgi:hypothetical protein